MCVVICCGAFAGETHTTFMIQTLFCASTLNDEHRAKLLEMFAIRVGGEDPLSAPKLQVQYSQLRARNHTRVRCLPNTGALIR